MVDASDRSRFTQVQKEFERMANDDQLKVRIKQSLSYRMQNGLLLPISKTYLTLRTLVN